METLKMGFSSLTKNKRVLMVFLLIGLLAISVQAAIYSGSVINPGFEGVKCWFYGVQVHDLDGTWTGENQFHAYQDAEVPVAIRKDYNVLGWQTREDKIEWTNFAVPNDAGLGWSGWESIIDRTSYVKPDLKIHVESNVKLSDITRQGDPDPLAWNTDDPLEGRRIEYWSKTAVQKTETDDKVIYEYTLTKESFLITPAEFWVGFYMVPSQQDAGTGSLWREGEYQDLTAWFMLDFHTWDNAYYDDWMEDPQDEVYTTQYNGTITNSQRIISDTAYRGGFPICGWIQEWEKADWTSAGGNDESPVWYEVRGVDGSRTLTQEQLWNLRDQLMSKVEFSPDMVGTFISLYDEPSSTFSYEPAYTDFADTEDMTGQVKAPDSSMKKTMYFPISIDNFGTYVEGKGIVPGWSGWNVYYPSAYFRIRMIYGVYGTFKYLWTEEVTKPFVDPTTGDYTGGLDYPDDFETHGTTVITTTGLATPFEELAGGILGFFDNPLNLFFTMFVILIVTVIIVTVLNPGLWKGVLDTYNKGRGKKRKGL